MPAPSTMTRGATPVPDVRTGENGTRGVLLGVARRPRTSMALYTADTPPTLPRSVRNCLRVRHGRLPTRAPEADVNRVTSVADGRVAQEWHDWAIRCASPPPHRTLPSGPEACPTGSTSACAPGWAAPADRKSTRL